MRPRRRRTVAVLLAPPSFSRGRIAAGLLFLRLTLGAIVITHSVLTFGREPLTVAGLASILAGVVAGALLLAGLFTAVAALAVGVLCASATLSLLPCACLPDSVAASVLAAATGVSIALLGPGALSADAHLFGPREIIVPPGTTSHSRGADGAS